MTHTVFGESAVIIQSVIFGLIAGLLFELFRSLRSVTPANAALVALEDVVFWIIFAFSSVVFFVKIYSGRLELFPVFAVLSGFLLFYSLFGRLGTRLRTRAVLPLKRRIARLLQKKRTREKKQKGKSLNIFNKIERKVIFFKKSSSKKPKNDIK